ncbi:hypothetical protein M0R19_05410 [Candidatus Pacearchaeota archaeon]|jgi:hypothetical protein|nr:hypothetical protein [Candidatus Pacearchaeota archaeon]
MKKIQFTVFLSILLVLLFMITSSFAGETIFRSRAGYIFNYKNADVKAPPGFAKLQQHLVTVLAGEEYQVIKTLDINNTVVTSKDFNWNPVVAIEVASSPWDCYIPGLYATLGVQFESGYGGFRTNQNINETTTEKNRKWNPEWVEHHPGIGWHCGWTEHHKATGCHEGWTEHHPGVGWHDKVKVWHEGYCDVPPYDETIPAWDETIPAWTEHHEASNCETGHFDQGRPRTRSHWHQSNCHPAGNNNCEEICWTPAWDEYHEAKVIHHPAKIVHHPGIGWHCGHWEWKEGYWDTPPWDEYHDGYCEHPAWDEYHAGYWDTPPYDEVHKGYYDDWKTTSFTETSFGVAGDVDYDFYIISIPVGLEYVKDFGKGFSGVVGAQWLPGYYNVFIVVHPKSFVFDGAIYSDTGYSDTDQGYILGRGRAYVGLNYEYKRFVIGVDASYTGGQDIKTGLVTIHPNYWATDLFIGIKFGKGCVEPEVVPVIVVDHVIVPMP